MIKSVTRKPFAARLAFYLRERQLWWRHAGWFTFAHKPLCHHYHGDTVSIGQYRVCRSCLMVYMGIGLMSLAIALLYPLGDTAGILTLLAIVSVAGLSYPPIYMFHTRPLRDALRAALGATIALSVGLLLSGEWIFGLPAALSLVALWLVFGHKRQATKRQKCQSCPEFTAGSICSGYRAQSQSIRAYEQALEQLVRAKTPPKPAVIQRFERTKR